MKTNNLKYAIASVLVAGLYTVHADDTLSASKNAEIKSALTGVSLSDAVKNSVSLVVHADGAERSAVAVEVLQTVAHTHGVALPRVVAAIVSKAPDVAVDSASEAARLHPEEVVSITRAAVQAAPAQAGAIVESVLFFAPERYQEVGLAAIDAAPSQSRQILHAVSINSVEARAYIENALIGSAADSSASAKDVLRHATLASKHSTKFHPLDLSGGTLVAQDTSAYGGTTQYGAPKQLNVTGINSVGGSAYMPPPIITTPSAPIIPSTPVVITVSQTSVEQPGSHTYSTP